MKILSRSDQEKSTQNLQPIITHRKRAQHVAEHVAEQVMIAMVGMIVDKRKDCAV